jgi:hypothetical protein
MGIRVWLKALFVGCAIGVLPLLGLFVVQHSQLQSPIWDKVLILYVPGALLGMLLNGGRAHDIGQVLFVAGACAFYTVVSYVVLRTFQKPCGHE